MVQDAEAHAEEDRQARDQVDARNHAEAMVHSVRKTLTEAGDKVEASDKENIESAIKALEEVLAGDDVEQIKEKTTALMEASHKLAEQMYQEQGAEDPTASPDDGERPSGPDGDDVVDAEFEEVKDKDKNRSFCKLP